MYIQITGNLTCQINTKTARARNNQATLSFHVLQVQTLTLTYTKKLEPYNLQITEKGIAQEQLGPEIIKPLLVPMSPSTD